MKIRFCIILCFTFFNILIAQETDYNPLSPPNTFQNTDNPNYWGNRLPYAGYWQQDVYYNIEAKINEKDDIIEGTQQLTYWNNSPDTLYHVFFHLYQNAFNPCSYYHDLHLNNNKTPNYNKYEEECLGTTIEGFTYNGKKVDVEYDNTIMKVYLPEPLLPNQKAEFNMDFITYFGGGSVRRRMKQFTAFGYKHYNGVHWHPRIAVYDRKFGWNTSQHLGREFYSDFGTYDVELNFPNNFIVEATGYLQNRDEVMPDTLRAKLDIKNFKDKELNSDPSVIIEYDSTKRKTWIYHAENVHNFAFTASPIYRIGEDTIDGIRCIALVQEPHAAKWLEVAEFTSKVVDVYNKDFGKYGYHKMIVADARDGMEYPMLTLCGGLYPSNKGLIAHEVGHNWFYGMIGNNETYRADLDEGFTQFLTAWSMIAIDGKYMYSKEPKSKYKAKFKEPVEARDRRVYYGYMADAIKEADHQLNTHSDMFNGALRHGGGYRHVYYKTATMLYNLQYVLGDTLFLNAMKHYFNQWKYGHPYHEDLRNSFIQYTKVDLNWFFDQWLETIKNIDYKVESIKKDRKYKGDKNQYQITIKRKGRMQMPIDLRVYLKNGDSLDYYIPNTWFAKETDATTLSRWIGWDRLKPTYTATIEVNAPIKKVVIDPSIRLADVNMTDNSLAKRIDFGFEHWVRNYPDWKSYKMTLGPRLWWNAYDGLKLGANLSGNFMNYKHQFSLSLWGNTTALTGDEERYNYSTEGQTRKDFINYEFSYTTGLDKILRGFRFHYQSKYLDGFEFYKTGFSQKFKKGTKLSLYYMVWNRPGDNQANYLLYPTEFEQKMINSNINLILEQGYKYKKGKGTVGFTMRSTAIASDYNYQILDLELKNHTKLWKFELHSRVFGRYGTGNNIAPESVLKLAGANNEELMDNPLTRSIGFVPPDWVGYSTESTNHFHYGGGLNIRGYSGYLVVDDRDGELNYAYVGNSGVAANLELDLDGLVKWRPKYWSKVMKIEPYLFADAGSINYTQESGNKTFNDIRVDAGAGVAWTIKKWGPWEKLKPLTLRFDVPFFLNRPPATEDYIEFRWVIGVKRSF